MSAKFNDIVSVDGGIQQFSIGNFFTDWTGASYNFLDIKTTVPAPSSYVMVMIEIVGYNYNKAQNARCAWNFYTYYYDIGNINSMKGYGGIKPVSNYSAAGYWCLKMDVQYSGYVSFTINGYAVAGNGARYPIGIQQMTLNNTAGNYF